MDRRRFLRTLALTAGGVWASRWTFAAEVSDSLVLPCRLHLNESFLGPSPEVSNCLHRNVREVALYPDVERRELKALIAWHHQVEPNQVIVGCGSTEILLTMLLETAQHSGHVLMTQPGFHLLRAMADLVKVPIETAHRTPDGSLDLEAFLARATEPGSIAYLSNPDNPTGHHIDSSKLAHAVSRTRSLASLLVVDEAYLQFAEGVGTDGCLQLARQGHALVIRTFSKLHGLAGLRVGYGVGAPDLIARLERRTLPGGVGRMAEIALKQALDDSSHLENARRVTQAAMTALKKGLDEIGIKTAENPAPFLLAPIGPSRDDVARKLSQGGILVHSPDDAPESIRISAGDSDSQKRLLTTLAKELGHR